MARLVPQCCAIRHLHRKLRLFRHPAATTLLLRALKWVETAASRARWNPTVSTLLQCSRWAACQAPPQQIIPRLIFHNLRLLSTPLHQSILPHPLSTLYKPHLLPTSCLTTLLNTLHLLDSLAILHFPSGSKSCISKLLSSNLHHFYSYQPYPKVSYDTPRYKLTPERALPLIKWFEDHKDHPYPSRCEKMLLCQSTLLTFTQVQFFLSFTVHTHWTVENAHTNGKNWYYFLLS